MSACVYEGVHQSVHGPRRDTMAAIQDDNKSTGTKQAEEVKTVLLLHTDRRLAGIFRGRDAYYYSRYKINSFIVVIDQRPHRACIVTTHTYTTGVGLEMSGWLAAHELNSSPYYTMINFNTGLVITRSVSIFCINNNRFTEAGLCGHFPTCYDANWDRPS